MEQASVLPADLLRSFSDYLHWDEFTRFSLSSQLVGMILATAPRHLKVYNFCITRPAVASPGYVSLRPHLSSLINRHQNFVSIEIDSSSLPAFCAISPQSATSLSQTLVSLQLVSFQSLDLEVFIGVAPIMRALRTLKVGLVSRSNDLRSLLFKTPNIKNLKLLLNLSDPMQSVWKFGQIIAQSCPKVEKLSIREQSFFISSYDKDLCKDLMQPLWPLQHLRELYIGPLRRAFEHFDIHSADFWNRLDALLLQLWPPGQVASPGCKVSLTDLLECISQDTTKQEAEKIFTHPLVISMTKPSRLAELLVERWREEMPQLVEQLLSMPPRRSNNDDEAPIPVVDLCYMVEKHYIKFDGPLPLFLVLVHAGRGVPAESDQLLRTMFVGDETRPSPMKVSLKRHPGFKCSSWLPLYVAIATSGGQNVRERLEGLKQLRDEIIQATGDSELVGSASSRDHAGLSIFRRGWPTTHTPHDVSLTEYLLEEGAPANLDLLIANMKYPKIVRLVVAQNPRILVEKENSTGPSGFASMIKSMTLHATKSQVVSLGAALNILEADESLRKECFTDVTISLVSSCFKVTVNNCHVFQKRHHEILRRLFSVLDEQKLRDVAKASILAAQMSFLSWQLEKVEGKLPEEHSILYLLSDAYCKLEIDALTSPAPSKQSASLLCPPGKLPAPPMRNDISRQSEFDDSYAWAMDYKANMAHSASHSVHIFALRIIQVMSKSALFPELIAVWNKHQVPVLHACIAYSASTLAQIEASRLAYFQIRSTTAKILLAAGIDTKTPDDTGHSALDYAVSEEKRTWIQIFQEAQNSQLDSSTSSSTTQE